jgi:hypothetical protein
VKNAADLVECLAKKSLKRCLTGKRRSVTNTVAAGDGAEAKKKKKPLDSGRKAVRIKISTNLLFEN